MTPAGAPLPRPVGFVCDGDGDGRGGDIVVLSGTAHVDADAPAADANPAWLDKYAAQIEQFRMTPGTYAARFSVPVRIRLTRVDGR